MYEAFRGVDGPDAEATRSDIFKLLLTVNYLLCLRVILIDYYCSTAPRPRKSLYDLRTLTFFCKEATMCRYIYVEMKKSRGYGGPLNDHFR